MDKVYEELVEDKVEIEKVKAELIDKTDSLQNMMKSSHDALINQMQATNLKVKLDEELLHKEDEINDIRPMYEDLKENLDNKDSIIKHISAENNTLQAEYEEKFKKLEDEKTRLALVLEEANEKLVKQEQQIYEYRQEIESLKGCLSVSNMCLEIEENLKGSKELGGREDMLLKLEDENITVDEQLNWKEDSKHLEEALEKLRDQYRSDKYERELETSKLLDEISSLQIKLDSQVRISQDLQRQLEMCNQALAQRKCLGVDVSDSKERFDNVSNEYQHARSQLEDPKYSLITKDAYYQESKHSIEKLEKENHELRMSLKELQEAGTSYSESKLLSELRNLEQIHKECDTTFKVIKAEWNFHLEQMTGTINSLQIELEDKTAAVEELKMELESSNSLTAEMLLLNEELTVMQLVLQEGISEIQLNLSNEENEMKMKYDALMSAQEDVTEEHDKTTHLTRQIDSHTPAKKFDGHKELQEAGTSYSKSKFLSELINVECDASFKVIKAEWIFHLEQMAETINSLQTELENKTVAVDELKMDLESSHSLIAELMLLNEELSVMLLVFQQGISENQLKLSNYEDEIYGASMSAQKDINEEREKAACLIREESYVPAKELEGHKEMLEESNKCQLLPKEKVMQMELDLEEQVRVVYDALDKANIELNETLCERNEMELELQMWMSCVERLKNDLEENRVMRKRLEISLLAQVDFSESLKEEKHRLVCELEGKDNRIDSVQQHVLLEQELKVRDTEGCVATVVTSMADEVRYLQMIEKNKILEDLKKEVFGLEQQSFRKEVESAVIAEIKGEKTNKLEKESPVKEENMRIYELMQQVTSLEQHCTSSLTSISSQLVEKQAEINQVQEACDKIKAAEIQAALESKQIALDIESEIDEKQSKRKDLTYQMENKLEGSEVLLQELKMENRNLLENASRLSMEKENLLRFIRVLYDKMCDSTTTDTQIIDMLNSLVQYFETNSPEMKKDDEFLAKDNLIMHSSAGKKNSETISDIRSPFKELDILLEG
ncbi:hypothetical protein RIF29_36372 [Crotalaria pallida]|uniref:Uncharacterized protein n=1 Tax=Crotalaria pallida TaxID=3830 RepID=A0AAN9EB12_CROPI